MLTMIVVGMGALLYATVAYVSLRQQDRHREAFSTAVLAVGFVLLLIALTAYG